MFQVETGRDDSLTKLTYEVEQQSASPSRASRLLNRSPSNAQPLDMNSLMLTSNLMGRTHGLVPCSGYAEPRQSKGGGCLIGNISQLNTNLVPNNEAQSTLIKPGAVYTLAHTHKDTESHIGQNLVPHEEFDAGIGFEGWYTNGEHQYIRPVNQIDLHRGAADDEASVWTEGWYNGGRGSSFALPVRHICRSTGMQHAEQTSIRPPVAMRGDIEFKPAPRHRAVERKSPTGAQLTDPQWTTSYDTQFLPMNERLADRRKAKPKSKKEKKQFNWKRRQKKKYCCVPEGQSSLGGWCKESEYSGREIDFPRRLLSATMYIVCNCWPPSLRTQTRCGCLCLGLVCRMW